jgi:hypothetical protein
MSFWVDGPGPSFLQTRESRNILSARRKVALIIDDLVSFDPFVALHSGVRGLPHLGSLQFFATPLSMVHSPSTSSSMPHLPIRFRTACLMMRLHYLSRCQWASGPIARLV